MCWEANQPEKLDNFTVHLFDPRVTRLYQSGGSVSKNEHSAGLKASLMIRGPLTLTLTKPQWKYLPKKKLVQDVTI